MASIRAPARLSPSLDGVDMCNISYYVTRILASSAALAIAVVAAVSLLAAEKSSAQQGGPAYSDHAATGHIPGGTMRRVPFPARRSGLDTMSPQERAAFDAAFLNSPRSGPTNLPRARMRAVGPVGPAVRLRR
jgi:hypothetical protein